MFLPKSIDLGQPEKYNLSIRISPTGFKFSIVEPGMERNYCLRETTFPVGDNLLNNIQRTVFDLNFLTQEFKQTNVIIASSEYDFIPAAHYQAKEKEYLYNFTHTKKGGHILSGFIEKQDIVTLFNIDKDIFEFLSRNIWVPRFFHHTNLLVNHFENRGTTTRMHLNFHDNILDVVAFEESRLLHCITYEDETAANQIYFILKLWEQCSLDQLNHRLYITGNPEKETISKLQEYIKHIEQLNAPSEAYLWNEDAQKAPLDLLMLSL